MMKNPPMNMLRRSKYILLLLGILFFHLYMNYEVLSKSHVCRVYDEVNRLTDGIKYHRIFFWEQDKLQQVKDEVLKLKSQPHPPFVQVIQALAIKLLSFLGNRQYDVESVILLTNGFFLFILLFSVYGIGSIVYSKNAGILAAFLVSFFPMVYGHSRIMMLDFPLASMVTLWFYCLFRTQAFNSAGYSILLGVVAGLTVLTKEVAVIFIIVPLLYYFYKSYREQPHRKTVVNAALALLFFLLVAGVVYLRPVNFFVFKYYTNLTFFLQSNSTGGPLIYLKSLLLYPGAYLFIALVPALVIYFRSIRWQNKAILLWFLVPLVVTNFIPNKSLRFLIPIFPAFALIVAEGISRSRLMPKAKRRYVYAVVFAAFLQYFIYFFNFSFPKPLFKKEYSQADFPAQLTYRNDAYYQENLKILEFFGNEEKKLFGAQKNVDPLHVTFLFQIAQISSTLRSETKARNLPFAIYCPEEGMEAFGDLLPYSRSGPSLIPSSDYIIDISGAKLHRTPAQEKIADMLRESFEKNKLDFDMVFDFMLFDGSRIYIYKNSKRLNYDQ